ELIHKGGIDQNVLRKVECSRILSQCHNHICCCARHPRVHHMKSRTWHIRVREWFPPDDRVATIMAQLCVLREDLYLELEGLKQDEIQPLDHNGDNFRSAYFFRNSTKTLFEMRKAVQNLKRQADFMKKLANQKDFHTAFKDFDKAMFNSRNLLKRLRHETS